MREGAERIFAETCAGNTLFCYHPEKLGETCNFVLSVIRENYPDLKIPFHSRWGHFRSGGVDRNQWLKEKFKTAAPVEFARIRFDLVIPSVLLDAGAGAVWKYQEERTGLTASRSEGLGVASIQMFLNDQLPATARGLASFTEADLERGFQVSADNPLLGVSGRVLLLRNLGKALENKSFFKDGRPGNLVDHLMEQHGRTIPAKAVLKAVLLSLGPIWPGRLEFEGVNLGDVWNHSRYGMTGFHKLSQWMTYSLLEPLMDAGLKVTGVEELTGLAEYRNGGLFLDSGLISFKDPALQTTPLHPSTDAIIEWRALTVALLDRVGNEVREKLKLTPAEFPLAKVLEGGTWWAGRKIAKLNRNSSEPPLRIESDGTVF